MMIAYTDGACSYANNGNGGWAFLLRDENGTKIAERNGSVFRTTNNQMEMRAAIEALLAVPEGESVIIYSDSEYLVKGALSWIAGWKTKGWKTKKKKPVKNRDLWEKIDNLQASRQVKWQWVRGHDGNPDNERCDGLASAAMMRLAY
jgi:ribonuclease HI